MTWREWREIVARRLCPDAATIVLPRYPEDDEPYVCEHIPAESVRDDGVRLCAICHEPLKENTE